MMSLPQLYNEMVNSGEVSENASQREVASLLEALRQDIHKAQKNAGIGKLFKKQPPAHGMRGIYLWGSVGRGKSMLMDMFFRNVDIQHKRRVHFHAFMQEVHARIHVLRNDRKASASGADPVVTLAQQLARESQLLCFDELQAPDVTDATLLYRLFQGLLDAGIVIVSTSNRPPETLYTGGVQKERFDKFIALLQGHMQVVHLQSDTDYRMQQLKSLQKVYFYPLGNAADQFIHGILQRLCPGCPPQKDFLSVHGRQVEFIRYNHFTGQFTFDELCAKPLGPADYLAIAHHLGTVILTGIPRLGPEKRNESKRFVTFIDTLYEQKVKLICTAEVAVDQLYTAGDGTFEFQRTISRLVEMQSEAYLKAEKPFANPPKTDKTA
jgi:cell division protein ZapE